MRTRISKMSHEQRTEVDTKKKLYVQSIVHNKIKAMNKDDTRKS